MGMDAYGLVILYCLLFERKSEVVEKSQVEWIQECVGLCFREFESEQEKKICFSELEKKYRYLSEESQKSVRGVMTEQFEVNDMVYLLSVMVHYMDVQVFRADLLESLCRGDFDCITGAMLNFQVEKMLKGEYRRKRIFLLQNIGRFDKALAFRYPYLPKEKRNKKRIILVAGQLLPPTHAPSKMIMDIVYVLQEYLKYELLVFLCPCDREVQKDFWYRASYERTNRSFEKGAFGIRYRDTIIRGYQINMGEWCDLGYNMMFEIIYAWNPAFVLNCATANPVAECVNHFTTMASMPMSIACPVSEANILIRLDKEDDRAERDYEESIGENQVQLFMEETFPVLAEMRESSCTRAEFGLPEERFLIAIVGNRLGLEIDLDFLQVMKRILQKAANTAFVIIGSSEEINPYFEEQEFLENVYCMGYRKDLMDVYQTLDLFLNPKRSGGGFSSALTLNAEIPVVTLPGCDVAYNCGKEFVVQDYEEMVNIVCRYVEDKEFYDGKKKCAQAYKDKNTDEKLVQYVGKMIEGITGIIERQDE